MSSGYAGHMRFEELCTLASIGQITQPEYQELSAHLRECLVCRDTYQEVDYLTHDQLPLIAAQSASPEKPAGILENLAGRRYKARFAARMRERGLEIAGTKPGRGFWTELPVFSIPRFTYRYGLIVVILALLWMMGSSSRHWKNEENRNAALSAQLSHMREQNAALEHQMIALSQDKKIIVSEIQRTPPDTPDLSVRVRDLETKIQKDSEQLQTINAQLSAANDRNRQADQKLHEAQQTLQAANQELAKLRASQDEDEATLTDRQYRVAELTRRVDDQEEVIDKQQKLLSVDTDVRNLMAARSLHITDVFDVDGRGKKKRSFGRVFYTEGKSLIFYAFDLDLAKAITTKHVFQAWGQPADSSSAISLGILYVDDPAQRRWMLRFDNPEVLKRLNAVFVTAEPHGGTTRPTGQKLMYAYLGHEPNHP
jgi:hypothetical protein